MPLYRFLDEQLQELEKIEDLPHIYGNTINVTQGNVAINSQNINQSADSKIVFNLPEIVDKDLKDKLDLLLLELKKHDKDEIKIKNILKYVGDKSLDVLITVVTSLIMK